jgi:hypothetical protein
MACVGHNRAVEGADIIMAKKPSKSPRKTNGKTTRTTSVRNTPIPRSNSGGSATATAVRPSISSNKREITREQIAERAYFISQSSNCSTQDQNWLRAERELRAERDRGTPTSTFGATRR